LFYFYLWIQKYIHQIHPCSPFPWAHPPPTCTHPQKRLIFPPTHHVFYYVYIGSPRRFHLGTSCLTISFFNWINPFTPLLTLSLSPCSPNIQQLTVWNIVLYSYMDGLFQYFSFSNSFFNLSCLL
jgi:hypothetical protein